MKFHSLDFYSKYSLVCEMRNSHPPMSFTHKRGGISAAMELIYLKTFLEVIKTGSFTKAAENLCVSQPAVSRRIKFMEVQYDCQLLDRSDGLLTPTEQGKFVQEKAALILSLEQELLAGLKQNQPRKRITFACTPTFGVAHLPKIQREFVLARAAVADLNFTLESPEEILEGLRQGRYGMAVVEHCQDYDLRMFHTVSLPDDDIVFATAGKLTIELHEDPLTQLFQLIHYGRNDGCCSRKLLEKNLHRFGHSTSEFRRIVAFDDIRTIIEALGNGDGVAFLSRDLIKKQLESGALRGFHLPGFTHTRKRTLVFAENFTLCKVGELFVKLVIARLEGMQYSEVKQSLFVNHYQGSTSI